MQGCAVCKQSYEGKRSRGKKLAEGPKCLPYHQVVDWSDDQLIDRDFQRVGNVFDVGQPDVGFSRLDFAVRGLGDAQLIGDGGL